MTRPRSPVESTAPAFDWAVAAGLALAAGDDRAAAALRVALARLLDGGGPVAETTHVAGLAAVAEVLVAFEDARRVQAEHDRQARVSRPLRESILVELVHRGPSTVAELAAASRNNGDRVRYALRRLTRDGLVRAAPASPNRARRHELSHAGVAAAMTG